MARPVIGVLILLLVASAQATSDEAGDVSRRIGDAPVEQPAVDILDVDATLADGVIDAVITVAGELPLDGDGSQERRFSYLFVIGLGAGPDDNLYQHVQSGNSVTVTCDFQPSAYDLSCAVTGGDAILRGSGATGRNVTMRIALDWEEDFAVGAIAHESIANATSGGRDIIAQDFTSNALPYQGPVEGDGDAFIPVGDEAGGEVWWRTPWVFVVAAVIVIVGLTLINGRRRS